MEKQLLENYLNEGLSFNEITKLTQKSLTTILYWAKKHKLKSNFKSFKQEGTKVYGDTRFCARCQSYVKTSMFYSRRGKPNSSVYCMKCTGDQTTERMRSLKLKMVEYKGGCCEKCGYKNYIGALEFHHLEPNQKDFNPSKLKTYSFDDRVKSELDKCALLCANCHREAHFMILQEKSHI